MSDYRVDESFGIVPGWLIDSKVSDRAIRLYALLSWMRDYGTDMATVGRKLLASKLGCSDDSLDRAKAELEQAGAISVERGRAEDGQIAKNIYTIHRISPGTRTAAGRLPARGRVEGTGAARSPLVVESSSSSSSEQHPSPPRRQGRAPTQIGGKRVTADEEAFALDVLGRFNEVSGRKFASKEALGKIILRHREHPELAAHEHEAIIREQFEHPWWRGDPSPSVIYGSGDVFDRALNGVRGADRGDTLEDDELSQYDRIGRDD